MKDCNKKRIDLHFLAASDKLLELTQIQGYSLKTLQRKFDVLPDTLLLDLLFTNPIILLFDVTIFSRSDGVFIFRANKRNLHWHFIAPETLTEARQGLIVLEKKRLLLSRYRSRRLWKHY